ncbi:MarR family winged helix-turn-helix transcriptional regulator [Lactobacillus xylocopicola]|uniref:MarR family transcriptional regulator n=1 Tax=Lactobacillus xylocopicola TaxID=2976676 RepID=A0ABN6SJB0_9LACO|nr:MarR family transcriptional regulator [Lactobacillus xylocopicola]BDR60290.1 MarR family transcriptional regulator [Lactobacillus xylocopicola]
MNRLGLILQRVQNTFNRNVDQYARGLGLTGMQMLIIEYLASLTGQRTIYQKDIEHEFNIRKSTATNILHLMEQRDLIIREVDQQDTRFKAVRLTAKAVKLKEQITTYFINSEEETARILGDQTKLELMENLQKLDQTLAEK